MTRLKKKTKGGKNIEGLIIDFAWKDLNIQAFEAKTFGPGGMHEYHKTTNRMCLTNNVTLFIFFKRLKVLTSTPYLGCVMTEAKRRLSFRESINERLLKKKIHHTSNWGRRCAIRKNP